MGQGRLRSRLPWGRKDSLENPIPGKAQQCHPHYAPVLCSSERECPDTAAPSLFLLREVKKRKLVKAGAPLQPTFNWTPKLGSQMCALWFLSSLVSVEWLAGWAGRRDLVKPTVFVSLFV